MDTGPTVQALRAAQKLILDGKAAAPEAWLPRLLELAGDPRPGVRVTALEAAGAWGELFQLRAPAGSSALCWSGLPRPPLAGRGGSAAPPWSRSPVPRWS